MRLILSLAIFMSTAAYATPDKVDIWFLKPSKIAMLREYLNRETNYKMTADMSEGFKELHKDCSVYEDNYFHPQYGIHKHDENSQTVTDFSAKRIGNEVAEPKVLSNDNANLIQCDRGYYFDLYCGEATKEGKKKKSKEALEIWIDISGSFHEIDRSVNNGCARKSFAEKVQKKCGDQVSFSTFDVSLKQISGLDAVCIHVGTNSSSRMIDWIKRSEAKHLIMITDVSELMPDFNTFLSKISATIKGDRYNNEIGPENLLELADSLTKECK